MSLYETYKAKLDRGETIVCRGGVIDGDVTPLIVLTSDESGAPSIEALVSAYDVRYRMGFASYHTIKPGTFGASIAAQDGILPMFWQHNWDWAERPPIGYGQTAEANEGVFFTPTFFDTDDAKSVKEGLLAGALREWSIGYKILAMERDEDDDSHVFITKGELLEASAVLRGANPGTGTSVEPGQGAASAEALEELVARDLALLRRPSYREILSHDSCA